jgi:hypothetical protein
MSRVGGIVSETNFKFFIQFTGYVSLITILVLVLNAVCIAEIQHSVGLLFPISKAIMTALLCLLVPVDATLRYSSAVISALRTPQAIARSAASVE